MKLRLRVLVEIDHEAISDHHAFVDGLITDMKSDLQCMDHIEDVTILVSETEVPND